MGTLAHGLGCRQLLRASPFLPGSRLRQRLPGWEPTASYLLGLWQLWAGTGGQQAMPGELPHCSHCTGSHVALRVLEELPGKLGHLGGEQHGTEFGLLWERTVLWRGLAPRPHPSGSTLAPQAPRHLPAQCRVSCARNSRAESLTSQQGLQRRFRSTGNSSGWEGTVRGCPDPHPGGQGPPLPFRNSRVRGPSSQPPGLMGVPQNHLSVAWKAFFRT